MRCKNCSWNNPEGISRCEKCDAPLKISMTAHESTNRTCVHCGYELAKGMNVCPACGRTVCDIQDRSLQSPKDTQSRFADIFHNFESILSNYKSAFKIALIGALICTVINLIAKDMNMSYRLYNLETGYSYIQIPILSVIVEFGRYYERLSTTAFGVNVYFMTGISFLFIFIHSLNGLRSYMRFLIIFLLSILTSLGQSFMLLGSNPFIIKYSAYFWNILLQTLLPGFTFFYLALPSIVTLFIDFVNHKQDVYKKNIPYDIVFVLISMLLFTYNYWEQF